MVNGHLNCSFESLAWFSFCFGLVHHLRCVRFITIQTLLYTKDMDWNTFLIIYIFNICYLYLCHFVHFGLFLSYLYLLWLSVSTCLLHLSSVVWMSVLVLRLTTFSSGHEAAKIHQKLIKQSWLGLMEGVWWEGEQCLKFYKHRD